MHTDSKVERVMVLSGCFLSPGETWTEQSTCLTKRSLWSGQKPSWRRHFPSEKLLKHRNTSQKHWDLRHLLCLSRLRNLFWTAQHINWAWIYLHFSGCLVGHAAYNVLPTPRERVWCLTRPNTNWGNWIQIDAKQQDEYCRFSFRVKEVKIEKLLRDKMILK